MHAAVLPKNQLGSKDVSWARLGVVTSQVITHFHLDHYVCSMAGFNKIVSNPGVVGDHISTILAGDCMVVKVIEGHHWSTAHIGSPLRYPGQASI